ncbi:MAG: hypothetical protein FWB96_12710 [Defluviitaleaceae bacterium]|nr:hypothetical protein [Defluviitaleaceae bacterium]MCL2264004.1 hypothetical protein [Defluviitaleaceae bacterium]
MTQNEEMKYILDSIKAYQDQMSYTSDVGEKYDILQKMIELAKKWEKLTGKRMSGTEGMY